MTERLDTDSQDEIRKTITKSKNTALRALQNYDLDWDQIQFNQLSDTCTFKIKTSNDGDFLLRVHLGATSEEVNSEILWLDDLNAKLGDTLPKGVLDRNGARTVQIDHVDGTFNCVSLMRWVEGEHFDWPLTDEQAYKEGVLLANLHGTSQQFHIPSQFTRPIWGEESFHRSMHRFTKYYDTFLTDVDFALYQSAADKIISNIKKFRIDDESYGLVHGDLHQGNIIFHNGEPRPIDFGRCGFGYFVYDIAHTILGLYPPQRRLVLEGYESIRKLTQNCIQELETFMVMVMIENYSHHASDPREWEGLREEQPYAQAILKNFLNEEPFLFNEIKI
ncbi:phosphotransferase [Paenibacillus sp. GSMTC-2017]|uniref:phosphotransferase enzyme family protein n=1 Tax=Paenibacillus sp. GSMTC-2017 TaxID=2794350 RepID=UPI0018D6E492|nr:phosphotransferase [Paenibacillus sp. GSMTC-2017]MBH5318822.1 phosphotransferase [Paenibacillus sp. GSMTC-2017]